MSLNDWVKNGWLRLDVCRKKRNQTEYDLAGNISKEEARELIDFCQELKIEVEGWLKKNHGKFLP